jgi:NAD(P)-dependent dehydrogenase (short-subunit alcohol dehydrogenase family)
MRTAVIGTNQGLGLVLSRLLAEKGHEVFAMHRNNPSAALADIKNRFSNCRLIAFDVTSESMAQAAAEKIEAEGGKLDSLILVAGILADSDRTRLITEASIDDLRAALEVNALGTAIVIKHFHNCSPMEDRKSVV